MSQEIERKFLVKPGIDFSQLGESKRIVQAYLCSHPERTVRVRIEGEDACLTIKGKSNLSGTTRFEFEKEILPGEAEELLKICEPGVIEKTRTRVEVGQHTFEVDQFFGDNDGLILAEVELQSEKETFEKPAWLSDEVTGDRRYYNSQLKNNPFKSWKS